MRVIYADSHYWVALMLPQDQWHSKAAAAAKSVQRERLITSDEVLIEFLNFLSKYGSDARKAAIRMVRAILSDPNISVVPQTRDSFLDGITRYESRFDKEYSLTDCISMLIMQGQDINEILTHDHHFTQEGFTILL